MKSLFIGLCTVALCCGQPLKAQFVLYSWVRYSNTPTSMLPYLHPMYLSTTSLTNSDSTPNFTSVDTFARSALSNTSEPVTMDIEIWPYSPNSTLTTTINRYNAVIDTFRSVNPSSKIGFYGVPPQQRYSWTNLNTASKYSAWMVVNDSLSRMTGNVDIFFPSAYSRDTSTSNWQNYIDSNVSVIRNLYSATKPIYFYISPQYDGASAGEVNAQFIDTVRWKFLLNLVYSQANGAVIWTSNKDSLGNTLSWSTSMPWWTVTKEFMVQKGLVAPFVMDSLTATYGGASGQNIRWVTSADTTTSYFVVQRSTDSINFTNISGEISSLHSYYTENAYSYTDTSAASGKVYYRIEMVETGGGTSWSSIIPYSPPVSYRSAGTGVTVDLATATNWQTYNGSAWVSAAAAPNVTVTNGSSIVIQSADTWQNNTAAVTIPAGVTLIDSGANGVFSTTYKITASGTIEYSGVIAQSLPAIAAFTSSTLANLTINNPAGVSTTSGSWTLTGALNLLSGQFNCNAGGGSFYCKGTIVNEGGVLNAGGYLEMTGTGAQSLPANTLLNNTIYHLITGSGGVVSNGPINITNSIALGTGVFIVGGHLTINGATITTSGGSVLAGTDTVSFGSSAIQVIPSGFFSSNTVNYLTIKGLVSDTAKGALIIGDGLGITEIGSVTPLTVSGAATIGGQLAIGSFAATPVAGQADTILSAASLSGTFSGGVQLPAGYAGSLSYTTTAVVLTIDSTTGTSKVSKPADSLVVKTGDSTGNSRTYDSLQMGLSLVQLYPNPAHSDCLIQSKKMMRQIQVSDANGRTVVTIAAIYTNQYDLPVSGLSGGVYFITVVGDGFKETKRMVKKN